MRTATASIRVRHFNQWFDSPEGAEIQLQALVEGLANPSKAFLARDREAYHVALEGFRLDRRKRVAERRETTETSPRHPLFDRNAARFDQFCDRIAWDDVVPFIGARLSESGGLPTWKDHLRQQGRTAGMDAATVEDLLAPGLYEEIVNQIEQKRGDDVYRTPHFAPASCSAKIPMIASGKLRPFSVGNSTA